MLYKKQLGQNFLVDRRFVTDLVRVANLTKGDVVLEIGAGTGNVTKEILPRVKHLYAVEFDSDLITYLKELSTLNSRFSIINEDILRVLNDQRKIEELKITKIIGAIPYQITSPLIHLIIQDYQIPTTLLVQKEVAERITARPPHATYLSNFVTYWGEAKIVEIVPKEAFYPIPKVDGAIVTLTPRHEKPADTIKLSKFLHRGFANPRKMLNKAFPIETLKEVGVDPTSRPENLSLDDWVRLYKKVLS